MTTEKPSPFCDKCGQNKNLAHIARAQESAYQSLLEQCEAMERALEKSVKDGCDCGYDEPMGEGYTGGVCYQHEALEQFRKYKKGAGV